jgi:hypothetical protein
MRAGYTWLWAVRCRLRQTLLRQQRRLCQRMGGHRLRALRPVNSAEELHFTLYGGREDRIFRAKPTAGDAARQRLVGRVGQNRWLREVQRHCR